MMIIIIEIAVEIVTRLFNCWLLNDFDYIYLNFHHLIIIILSLFIFWLYYIEIAVWDESNYFVDLILMPGIVGRRNRQRWALMKFRAWQISFNFSFYNKQKEMKTLCGFLFLAVVAVVRHGKQTSHMPSVSPVSIG